MAARPRPTVHQSETRDALIATLWGPEGSIWPRVKVLRASRSGRREPEMIQEWDITHVMGSDTPENDADLVMAFCRDHANINGKSDRYIITALGSVPAPKPPKGKPPAPDLEEQPLAQWSARFGPDDALTDRGGGGADGSAIKALNETLRTIPSIYDAALHHAEGSLRVGALMNTDLVRQLSAKDARITYLEEQLRAEGEFRLRQLELQLKYDHMGRQDEREDRREAAAAQHAQAVAEIEERKTARIIDMIGTVGMKLLDFKLLLMQMKAAPPPVPVPEENDIAEELSELLVGLSDGDRAALHEALGDALWNTILDAAQSLNNEKSTAIMLRIKDMVRNDPRLMAGILKAGDILSVERASVLLRLMQRTGVIDVGSDPEPKPEPEPEPKRPERGAKDKPS